MRAPPSCRAVAFERDAERAARIARNASALGVPSLRVVRGAVPVALLDLAADTAPQAMFMGGGIGTPGLLDACWNALARGGRLVANVVTIEGEAALAAAQARLGGELARIAVARAEMIGSVLGWRPLTPVTQWTAVKR